MLVFKPGASVVVCRRGGASAAFDRLNKYFTILISELVAMVSRNMMYRCSKATNIARIVVSVVIVFPPMLQFLSQ